MVHFTDCFSEVSFLEIGWQIEFLISLFDDILNFSQVAFLR